MRVAFLGLLMGTVAAQQLTGNVDAVYDLLDRVLPGSRSHFELSISKDCLDGADGMPCYHLVDTADGKLSVSGTSANEVAAGIGSYLREDCNMTIGWPRGGGSNVFMPAQWPKVGQRPARARNTLWSYFMNVCTHSYSLVWYSWAEWEVMIDWMALSGINNVLAMTGQEEVQYKVLRKFGLDDLSIRSWFNGPALLTWSRGQNEYGSDIAGPLPRSWMKDQWYLQKQILARYRSLGIVGQLPGFQGNVPVGLKDILKDSNMTDNHRGTAWLDSLDPNFGLIADEWMKTLIEDFGTDHWYQLDGYFNGATAPWLPPPQGIESGSPSVDTSDASDSEPLKEKERPIVPDPTWIKRGAAAYSGLNRTDPEAMWSFQGWAFVGWHSPSKGDALRGFIAATPPGKFNVIDMSTNGEGEWTKWHDSNYWGAKFIWTTLHDFGGTNGLKGDLARINHIPFDSDGTKPTSVWGTGFTPEGIDQNPVYYEFIIDANWRTAPVSNIMQHVIDRSHRRYGLSKTDDRVSEAWGLLVSSAYAQDLSVQDNSGVPHFPGSYSEFETDRFTPTDRLCQIFDAWKLLQAVADDAENGVSDELPTFRYDLINTGRELLAQLTTPASMNFSDATKANPLDSATLHRTGSLYIDILNDIDQLVQSEPGFLMGSWIEMARFWGRNATGDCGANEWGIEKCDDFYEWNARTQVTTWNPTPKDAAKIPGGPIDYASKHWSGLVRPYYARRAELILQQALKDASKGQTLDANAVERLKAELAYNYTTSTEKMPTTPQGSPKELSRAMLAKYKPWYAGCSGSSSEAEPLIV